MKFFLVLFFSFFVTSVMAKPIEINVTDYGFLGSLPQVFRDTLDFYIEGVEDDLNSDQPIINPSRVNFAAANSSVLSTKGLGTDYVNNPKKFLVSVGIGGAYDAEKNKGIKDEISGLAAASSLTLGAPFDNLIDKASILGLYTKRLMGFVNFGLISHSLTIPGSDIDIASDITATNLGFHFRYDLVEKMGTEWWGWGGIKVHTGYEYNKNKVELSSTVDRTLEVDTGGAGILEGRLTGTPVLDVNTVTHSFPLEVSTSVMFLKIFSMYGGWGTDFNFGQSKGTGDVKGDVTGLICTSGVCVGETDLPQLEVKANYEAEAQVKSITNRAFLGLQLDLPINLHAFAQVAHWLGTEVNAASLGLKYSY